MNRLKILLSGFLFLLFFTGCVTYKADSSGLSTPDYNQRVTVTNPHYDGVLNPIGVTSIAATTFGAGYLGYQTNLIKYNSGTEQKTSKIGNAVIGAAVGFGTSYLLNRVFGLGKTKELDNAQQWVRKANRSYSLINNTDNTLLVIPTKIQPQYQIKNINDANQFISIFKNSKYVDDVFKTGLNNCKRDELPQLIGLFPQATSVPIAKEKYIKTSPTYEDIVFATNKYQDINNDFEPNFLSLIKKSTNAIDFKNRFTQSNNLKQAYLKAYTTEKQQKDDFINLNKLYLNNISLSITDLSAESKSIQRNFVNSRYILEEPKSLYDIVSIYEKFNALTYTEKDKDVYNACFSLLDNSLSDGNEVIWNFRRLSDRSLYPALTVNTTDINNIIENKLIEEANRNVTILSQNQLSNGNSQWDSWKEATYTAGIVGEKGAMFVLYGEVQNKSKYNIPIQISANAGLTYDIDLSKAARFFGISASKPVPGTQTSSFYIPSLPSRSKGAYAIRFDFKDNYQKGGINIFDIGKILIEAKLVNVTINPKYNYYASTISNSIINEQKETQNFVIYGIPNRDLGDLWRGGDVNKEEWEEKWEKEKQRRIEAAEYARTHPSYSSYSSNNDNDIETSENKANDDGQDEKKKPNRILQKENDNPMPNYKGKWYNDGDTYTAEFEDGVVSTVQKRKDYYEVEQALDINDATYKRFEDAVRASYYWERFKFLSVKGRTKSFFE